MSATTFLRAVSIVWLGGFAAGSFAAHSPKATPATEGRAPVESGGGTAPTPQEARERFEKAVADARTAAIDFLKRKQSKEGNWQVTGVVADMEGGCTALVTLTLLEAGVETNDATITKAVDCLAKIPPSKTHVAGLQTQVLARVDAKKHKTQIQANADWLVKTSLAADGKLTGWSYPGNSIPDGTNTHSALMGLHAAVEAGAKVDEKVWKELVDLYLDSQKADGWSYYPVLPGVKEACTRSMTVSALTGLTIAAKHLNKNEKEKYAKRLDEAFEKGMKVLDSWDLESPKSSAFALMLVAELGRTRGANDNEFKIGEKSWNWYTIGAEKLIKMQREDGSLESKEARGLDASPILATAFGLYLLGPPARKP